MKKKNILRISHACTGAAIILIIIFVAMMAGCNEPIDGEYEAEQSCLGYSNTDNDNVRIVQVKDSDKAAEVAKTIEWMKTDGFNLTGDYTVCTYKFGKFETYLIFEREVYQ
jgi:uncharacterized lipoprotein YajG